MTSEIQADIEETEAETAIFELDKFNARADAIDFIDFHIIDRIEGLIQQAGQNDELITLSIRAHKLKDKLEKIDALMFQQLEQQISTSKDKEFVFRRMIDELASECIYDDEHSHLGYDNLDIFINRLLSTNTIPDAKREPEPEMVFYQKTPARIIIELSKKVNRTDVFFDIGSGIGQVAILVNLISGARAIGIEFEPSYCKYAKEIASKFELANIKFVNEDARNSDYSEGTVFFLYTPFNGKIMQAVLALLQKIAFTKVIRIFTYGPCSMQIAEEEWLQCINGRADNSYKLFEFKSFVS